MKVYPAYKESGIEWLGDVPKHWKVVKIGRKCFVTKLAGYEYTKYFDYSVGGEIIAIRSLNVKTGKLNLSQIKTMPESVSQELPRSKLNIGDVVMGYIGTLGNVAIIPENEKFHLGPNVAKITPSKEISSKFLCYFILSSQFQDALNIYSGKTSQPFLSMETIRNIKIVFPKLPKQQTITNFLDRKTVQIDTLIEKKQRQIDLLQEQRTTFINQAVTKGLDPSVPMKDSGIEWLGEIPVHWEVIRNRYLFREKVQRSEEGKETLLMVHQKLGVVERDKFMKHRPVIADTLVGYKVCDSDDLVLNRMKAHLGVFYRVPQPGIVSPDYTVFYKISNIETEYYQHLFRHPGYVTEFIRNSKGVALGFFRLYTPEFYDIFSLVPPVEEQWEILTSIHHQTELINRQISWNGQLIEFLKEYRTALISATVTGKIDVRGE